VAKTKTIPPIVLVSNLKYQGCPAFVGLFLTLAGRILGRIYRSKFYAKKYAQRRRQKLAPILLKNNQRRATMTIDTTAYFITGLIYMLLAVLAWWLGKKLRKRCKRERIKLWVSVAAFFVAMTLLVIGMFAFYEAIKGQKVNQPIKARCVEV